MNKQKITQMELVQKSYESLLILVQNLNVSIKDGQTKGQKKLALIGKKVNPYLEDYNEKLDEIKLDNASVDKDGNLIVAEDGKYSYTKDATKNITKQVRELIASTFEHKLIPIINPDDLKQYAFLEGWVSGIEFEKEEEEEIEL